MNVEIGTEVTQFPEKDYINGIFVAVHSRLSQSGTYKTATALAYTLLKKIQIFLIFKEIQSGAVAKSYMRKGFLIYEEMRKYFPIYEEAVSHI
jgi:hypothetical protein